MGEGRGRREAASGRAVENTMGEGWGRRVADLLSIWWVKEGEGGGQGWRAMEGEGGRVWLLGIRCGG